MVLGNVWSVTVGYNGLYCTKRCVTVLDNVCSITLVCTAKCYWRESLGWADHMSMCA